MASGHGGARVGAGRKPKDRHLRSIQGGAARRQATVPTTNEATATAPIEEFDAPDSLTMDERHVWLKLAPHAFKSRTLTKASAMAFERHCQNVVAERALRNSATEMFGPNHRGMIKILAADDLRFRLTACGKEMYEADSEKSAPVSPVSRFLTRAK